MVTWKACFHGVCYLLSLYVIGSNVANAANECRIQINYKNNKNENINEIRNVDKGNATDINLSGMRFVKNLKNRQVKFLFQPGTVGVNDIILGKNQRNPAVGYFINPPRLQKVICLNDTEVTEPTTPEALIDVLVLNGVKLSDITSKLKQRFNLTHKQIFSLLSSAGFNLREIVDAYKVAFNLKGDALLKLAASVYKESGLSATEIARQYKDMLKVTAKHTMKILRMARFQLDDIVKAGRTVFSLSANELLGYLRQIGQFGNRQIARSLNNAGYPLIDIIGALQTVNGLTREQVNSALAGLSYTASQIQQGLDQVFGALENAQGAVTRAGTSAMHETGRLIGASSKIQQVRNNSGIIRAPSEAFPLSYGGNKISINGTGLGGITSVRGFPKKSLVRILSRSSNWLHLEVNVRPQVVANTRGRATMIAGKETTSLSFNWVVAGKRSAPPIDLVPISGRNAGSHIRNYYIVSENNSDEIRIRTGGTDQNPQFTNFYRVLPAGHCNGLSYPGSNNNGPRVSQGKRIRVSDYEWGVAINSQDYEDSLESAFTIRLQRGRQTLDELRITKNMSLDANARKIVKTPRSPPLVVTVYRIGNDSPNNIYKGCWSQEDPSQNRLRHDNDVVVEVDVENEIDESSRGERNNKKQYVR